MKYDDANWHCGSDTFPEDQPEEYGATHIGLFLKWCFIQGWAGALHMREEPDAVHAVSIPFLRLHRDLAIHVGHVFKCGHTFLTAGDEEERSDQQERELRNA